MFDASPGTDLGGRAADCANHVTLWLTNGFQDRCGGLSTARANLENNPTILVT